MQPLATVAELEVRLGAPFASAAETARALAALEDASAIIRTECGRTWDDDEPPEAVRVTALRVARRILANPDGFESETVGPVSASVSAEWAEGLLTLGERRMLRAAVISKRGGSYSVRTPSAYERG